MTRRRTEGAAADASLSRRVLLRGGLAAGLVLAVSGADSTLRPRAAAAAAAAGPGYPFTLGVASGEPTPDGMVLWTRLAPDPLAPDGLGGLGQRRTDVEWELATDERFRRVVRRGLVPTGPEVGHSVHVEPAALPPGREYFYRFRARGEISPTGRTRTAPAPSTLVPLTMCFASCAHFEHGFFTAYARLAEEEPDLVLHLGDYLYEIGRRPRLAARRPGPAARRPRGGDPGRLPQATRAVPDRRRSAGRARRRAVAGGVRRPRGGEQLGRRRSATDPRIPPGRSGRGERPRSRPTGRTCRCARRSARTARTCGSTGGSTGAHGHVPHARHPPVPQHPGL